MCQCPSLGFFHFYDDFDNSLEKVLAVSIPFFGLLSFLQAINVGEYTATVGVNALLRASLISTFEPKNISQGDNVSMLFFGLLSFLRMFGVCFGIYDVVCQCPSSGFSHFYRRIVRRRELSTVSVNTLLRASLISTVFNYDAVGLNAMCQCPSSGFSHFYRLQL